MLLRRNPPTLLMDAAFTSVGMVMVPTRSAGERRQKKQEQGGVTLYQRARCNSTCRRVLCLLAPCHVNPSDNPRLPTEQRNRRGTCLKVALYSCGGSFFTRSPVSRQDAARC